ncbi:MAG: hypothetical protein RL257_107 [Actinomycetota bacterium]
MESLDNQNSLPNSAAAALIGDPAKFGRVDENGTVFVRTNDGEKMVGSYPGKTPEEALAYFVRKFEIVASEVALLAARIISGAMVPEDAHDAVRKLRNQVEHLNGVGNLEALKSSLEQIPPLIDEHRPAYEAKKAAEAEVKAAKRAATVAAKEALVAEAEPKNSVALKVILVPLPGCSMIDVCVELSSIPILLNSPETAKTPPIIALPVVKMPANVGVSEVPTPMSSVHVVPRVVLIDSTPVAVL